MKTRLLFRSDDMRDLAVDAKVGLLATVTAPDEPHITLITTLEASSPGTLTWGQFCEGTSKANLLREPRCGFLVMTMDRRIRRGRARRRGMETEGEAYDRFNRKPMFRYNSYFGIHTVHHMDLVDFEGPAPLPLGRMMLGHATLAALSFERRLWGSEASVLNHFTEALLWHADTLKFVSYLDDDGYPVLLPAVPAVPHLDRRLLLASACHRRALSRLEPGKPVAVFALNQQLQSVLLRGRVVELESLRPISRRWPASGALLRAIEIDFVYNSMPPKAGRIYPREPLVPATFHDGVDEPRNDIARTA